jgi:2-methylisocitrate lyase-like PEP mutase family enzyme
MLDAKALAEIGYRIAIFPAIGFLAAGAALERAYLQLKANRTSASLSVPH